MTDTNMQTTDDAQDDSPVTAGKPKAKKAAPKAKAPATKKKAASAPAKKAASRSNGSANGDRKITLTKKESELRGKRQQVYKLIKNGMTVRELQEVAAKKLDDSFRNRALVVLKVCEAHGLCTVK